MALEQFDAGKARPVVEHFTRVVNDFVFANMFFVKNCSLLLREISDNQRKRALANESIHSESTWQRSASSHIDSVMSFETEELLHFRGRDAVSAYPLIRLTHTITETEAAKDKVSRANVLETLPERSETREVLLHSLTVLICLLRYFYGLVVCRAGGLANIEIIVQVEIYDLTSSERVRRGVKRAWLIGETLALETKYKGVRFRPDRSDTKPWAAEVKPPKAKNKVWIDDCNTPEAAALAHDVAAFYYGKGNEALNFEYTPRFLPKTFGDSCEQQKRRAIPKQAREQSRPLRSNPLFYLIHELPYELLFIYVLYEFFWMEIPESRIDLPLLVVELMRTAASI
ncbi:unnamed protein product [Sphagnum jensenii]|uniref:AP2/ERF domain-containing protein n=1 Tax=Sphagnum jensenii TaxID=128206 RepID=A0ABP1AMQ6_9BRYO